MRRAAALLTLLLLTAAIAGDLHRATAARTADPWVFPTVATGAVADAPGIFVAQASSTDEQRQREQYIQRALQAPAGSALAGRKEIGAGTGFFVSDHFLLTNHHVVASCVVLSIHLGDAENEDAAVTVVATDQSHDLALLKSGTVAAHPAELEARLDRADGSDLYIVGYPTHGLVMRRPNLTAAVARVGALATAEELFPVLADVHPGHSGSPLLDEYGAVVGVMTKAVDSVSTYAQTGKLIKNIGFAIPIRVVFEFLKAHAVPYRSTMPSNSLTPQQRLEQARGFVSQISCWQ